MCNPFFSVIVPTYNRAGFIHQTIQLVLAQQFDSFEVIVVDDGSTDNTQEIVQSITETRVYYFKKENAERAAARNFGIANSRGVYITFLDSDDLLLTNHLATADNFAVEECHLELRWAVGDHPDLPRQLESLARRMFLAGTASQRPVNLTLQTPPTDPTP